jgi:hypothetical protein
MLALRAHPRLARRVRRGLLIALAVTGAAVTGVLLAACAAYSIGITLPL